MGAARSPKLVVAAVAVVVVAVVVTVLIGSRSGRGWETWNDYGRWTIGDDRATVRTQRSGLTCGTDHRAVIESSRSDGVVLRFEVRPPGGDAKCDTSLCGVVAGGDPFACGVTLTLPARLPTGTDVRSVCQPDLTPYATTVPGGARITLGPSADGSTAVVCSPVPEPSGG